MILYDMFQNRYTIASFTLESGSHIRSERNWLTVGMHKNVAVPMRLAKRHDLTKSQIRLEINQNHATRHDLVHSLYKGFLAAFQESIYVVNRKQRCEAPFLMLFSSCFLFSRMCLFLGFVWGWQVLDGSKCTTHMCRFTKKTLCWEKSA